jgi:hypothetical protein
VEVASKTCQTCGKALDVSYKALCSACYQKQRRLSVKTQGTESQKQAAEKERIKSIERCTTFYYSNRERILAEQKASYPDRKPAKSAQAKEYRQTANGREREKRAALRNKYGLTLEQYLEMVASQNGLCAICHKPPRKKALNVDHCHDTDKVRALLCSGCNTAIGLLDEDLNILESAIQYIKYWHGLHKGIQ